MSKERELLNKAIELIQIVPTFGMYGLKIPENFGSELILETQELLAQPEQEPVAWMYDLDMMIHPISNTRSLRFGELTSISPADRPLQDAVNIRPLYLAPPKREPLSEKEIREGNQSMLNATRETFIAGVRFAEKMHGIGE